MSNQRKRMQNMIRYYKEQTGETQIDMKEVVRFAVQMGWKLPEPKDPLDMLAKEFSSAAREEIKHDEKTGRPYRANHALPYKQGKETLYFWIDIDEAQRPQILKSLVLRREQMVGDGLMLSYDADHWNSNHPEEEAIQLEMDLSFDIELRKNAADAEDEAA